MHHLPFSTELKNLVTPGVKSSNWPKPILPMPLQSHLVEHHLQNCFSFMSLKLRFFHFHKTTHFNQLKQSHCNDCTARPSQSVSSNLQESGEKSSELWDLIKRENWQVSWRIPFLKKYPTIFSLHGQPLFHNLIFFQLYNSRRQPNEKLKRERCFSRMFLLGCLIIYCKLFPTLIFTSSLSQRVSISTPHLEEKTPTNGFLSMCVLFWLLRRFSVSHTVLQHLALPQTQLPWTEMYFSAFHSHEYLVCTFTFTQTTESTIIQHNDTDIYRM